MIKVCHIVNIISGKADGVYTHLKMIFTLSDRTKFKHYLIFQGGERIEKELTQMGIEFLVSESFKKKISVKAFYDIYRFIKKNNISIVHTHFIKPYAIVGLINIFLRKKFIFNYHGLFISENVYYGVIEKFVYRIIHFVISMLNTADMVFVPSRRSKELLKKDTGLFPEPVVYYNGFDAHLVSTETNPELYSKIASIKKNKIVIALVGRLEIDKRIDRAINLFNNILKRYEKVQLLILGDGKLEDELKKLSKNLGLNGQIDFLGYVDGVNNYFDLFNIILFTSDWEAMPLTMWEAMAYKVPVLAPDVGGFKEILEENNCGLVYPPGNMKDAEEKLLKLIEDNKLRKELGENGSIAVKGKYNSSNFIRQIEDIYLNLYK